MSPDQRRFLILDQTIATGLITAAINAGIIWLVFGSRSAVPLWGTDGILADLAATNLLLPFFVCAISARIARSRIRAGKLSPLDRSPQDPGISGRLPAGARRRGLALGLICTATLSPLLALGFVAADVQSLPPGQFMAFKAIYTGLLAAVVGPLVGFWALLPVDTHQPETLQIP